MTMPAHFQPVEFVSLSVTTENEDCDGTQIEEFGQAQVSVDGQDVKLAIDNNLFSLHFSLSMNSLSARQLAKTLLAQADLCDQQANA